MTASYFVLMLSMPILFFVNGLLFFKQGVHNLRWFLTLLPFIFNLAFLLAFQAGYHHPLINLSPAWHTALNALGAAFCVGAIALFSFTVGNHRSRLPMWHQTNNLPDHLVTWGAYTYVRHPFYTSYYLYFIALTLTAPTAPILLTCAYGFLVLGYTAAKEEKELSGSVFGDEYRSMMYKTGRFFPRLVRARRAMSG